MRRRPLATRSSFAKLDPRRAYFARSNTKVSSVGPPFAFRMLRLIVSTFPSAETVAVDLAEGFPLSFVSELTSTGLTIVSAIWSVFGLPDVGNHLPLAVAE